MRTERTSRLPLVLGGLVFTALVGGCPQPDSADQPASSSFGAPPSARVPGSTRPQDARWNVAEGEGVEVSGTFIYNGTKTGRYRLDFLQMDHEGSPPRLVNTDELDKPGPWKITAPKNFGKLYVVAFVDQQGDGPSPDDPAGRIQNPIDIGTEPITGVDITVSDHPDLGDLGPRGGHAPSDEEPGAEGNAQPGAGAEPSLGTPSPQDHHDAPPGAGLSSNAPSGTQAASEGTQSNGGGAAATDADRPK